MLGLVCLAREAITSAKSRSARTTTIHQNQISDKKEIAHPVILVDCEKAVVGATVYRVKAVATVVALVATSTPSSAGSVSTM